MRHVPTFVVDQDRTRASRELVRSLTASGYFRDRGGLGPAGDLVEALDHGRAVAGVDLPRGFARDLARRRATVQLVSATAPTRTPRPWRSGYAERIVRAYGTAPRGSLGRAQPVELRARAWFNPACAAATTTCPP